jgi:hypothetical protein
MGSVLTEDADFLVARFKLENQFAFSEQRMVSALRH